MLQLDWTQNREEPVFLWFTKPMQMEEEAIIFGVKKTRGSTFFLLVALREIIRLPEIGTLRRSFSVVPEVLEKSLEEKRGELSEKEEKLKSSVFYIV